MKINKILAFGALAALATLSATLLFQNSITRADDHGKRGDDNERGDHDKRINNRFVILLAGVYKDVAVGHGPKSNLSLTTVNLNDGSYSKVKLYSVSGLPGHKDEDKAIGTFYVQFAADLCAYDLPGGSFSARFILGGDNTEQLPEVPLPGESWTLDGTFELDILEATGIYRPFEGGHIHMVDILKFRAGDGTFLEDCFCNVHPKLVKP
jgi:hypothetical protein